MTITEKKRDSRGFGKLKQSMLSDKKNYQEYTRPEKNFFVHEKVKKKIVPVSNHSHTHQQS